MSTTIAKLAVVVTADTSPLSLGLDTGKNAIKEFGHAAEKNLALAEHAFKNVAKTFGFGALGKDAVMGGAIGGIAGAGTLVGIQLAAEAARKLAEFVSSSVEAALKFEETIGNSVPEVSELAKEWEVLKIGIGEDLLPVVREFAALLANILHMQNELRKILTGRDIEGELAAVEARKKSQEELAKWMEEYDRGVDEQIAKQKELAREEERRFESLRSRAESLRQQFRTPGEVFKETAAELQSLREQTLITSETLAAGLQKAADDFDEATKRANQANTQLHSPNSVGAVERFTQAGYVAAQSGRDAIQKQVELAKMQLDQQKKIEAAIREQKPAAAVLVRSNF